MAALPTSPIAGVSFPNTELIQKVFAYLQKHNNPTVVNHVIRSTLFALIISGKIPHLKEVDPETIVLATLLHDLGWSDTASLISPDKRFEVDGANAARAFVKETADWDDHRLETVWNAIALHTSPSISLHAQPNIAAVTFGITADFVGPNLPGGIITVDELKEVVKAYPRLDFAGTLKSITCGLCRNKPETTYDNFVGLFGVRDVPGYKERWERNNTRDMLEGALKACAEIEN